MSLQKLEHVLQPALEKPCSAQCAAWLAAHSAGETALPLSWAMSGEFYSTSWEKQRGQVGVEWKWLIRSPHLSAALPG